MSDGGYDRLLQVVHASAAFELLRAALAFRMFEALEEPPEERREILRRLPIPPARMAVLIEGLRGIGLIETDGEGNLCNCMAISDMVQRDELRALRALVAFQAEIVAPGQRGFVDSLTTDRNEGVENFPGRGETLYTRLESDPHLRDLFFDYMQTYTEYASRALFEAHDFSSCRKILDVGGGGGALASRLALANPGARITVLDIEVARATFEQRTERDGSSGSVDFHRADMHRDDFPKGFDLVAFVHQLVIWSPRQNLALLRKAYDALEPGGSVLICSSILDDDRTGPVMALLDSVYFQSVASGVGQIYSFSQYRDWLSDAGFSEISSLRLNTWTPHGVVTARKLMR